MAFWSHATSRLALGLGITHVVLFVAIVFSEPPLPPPGRPCSEMKVARDESCVDLWEMWGIRLAGREFHHHPGFEVLSLFDLPTLVGLALLSPLEAMLPRPPREWWVAKSYLDAAVLLVLGTVQWWLIGGIAHVRRGRRRRA